MPENIPKRTVVVGAGPAGLTCAAELIENGVPVLVLDKDAKYVGGIARTVEYNGYRFDIGGHRFFSKSSEITQWWKRRLGDQFISVRRMSRIFYNGVYFDYPLKAANALFGLGVWTSFLCGLSYLRSRLFPIKPEKSFQDWVSNRFGTKLFNIFFKTYTEKVWGMPCSEISADWAAQRIKGLSLLSAVMNALFPKKPGANGKGEIIKTLIDTFEYPKLGPGMMWEKTRDDIRKLGGEILMSQEVTKINRVGDTVISVTSQDPHGGETDWSGENFIISMPLRDCVLAFDPPLSDAAVAAAQRLTYRDFLTVALMLKRTELFPDNWIYVHDPGVKLGRIQNFNNWSMDLVADKSTTCLGLEYFCFEGDDLWNLSEPELIELGKRELVQLGLARADDFLDGCVVRMEKSYPVYGPGYGEDVRIIREALTELKNIQPVGRNGMHKYNNQDHSMMTAILAAKNISSGGHYNIWQVNTDAEYHEEGNTETPDKSGRLVPEKIQ